MALIFLIDNEFLLIMIITSRLFIDHLDWEFQLTGVAENRVPDPGKRFSRQVESRWQPGVTTVKSGTRGL